MILHLSLLHSIPNLNLYIREMILKTKVKAFIYEGEALRLQTLGSITLKILILGTQWQVTSGRKDFSNG